MQPTAEIIPNEEQTEEEIVIPTNTQREDNAEPEDNAIDEDNSHQQQSLRPVHHHVANEVQIEKIINSINASTLQKNPLP